MPAQLKAVWDKIPQAWRDRAIGAGLTYIGIQYGPYAQEIAKCVVGH
jgi:hypothetical protein